MWFYTPGPPYPAPCCYWPVPASNFLIGQAFSLPHFSSKNVRIEVSEFTTEFNFTDYFILKQLPSYNNIKQFEIYQNILYLNFLSGNLALCSAIIHLRRDEWRKSKTKTCYSISYICMSQLLSLILGKKIVIKCRRFILRCGNSQFRRSKKGEWKIKVFFKKMSSLRPWSHNHLIERKIFVKKLMWNPFSLL